MIVRYDRPVSRSAFLARRLALFALVMVLLVIVAHRFGFLKTPDFVALVLVAALPAAFAVPLALIGLMRLWQIGALGGIAAVQALAYAALPLALPGYGYFLYESRPMLTEVSTDLNDRPAWVSVPEADQQFLPRPPLSVVASTLQAEHYPGLNGRRYEGAIDRVYEAVRKVAVANGLVVTASRGEAEALPDLQLRPAEDGTTATPPASASTGTPPAEEALPESGPLPMPRPDAISALIAAAEAGPAEPDGEARLQLATKTFLLGLPFDAVVRLKEEAEMTLVDIRVAARYGPHDLGFSDEIAEGFLHALDAELLGIAGN
ncbi:DUF1499 domain-containing protein [Rhizobium sp. AG855]|uniref:DUF1499 domain-containing protein n=1 Tax=Rhizobium sp. AG855 TaxID=2183898 RepID=UPI000E75599A|nr:DUF1499 domain-containing protein [Rhizobium sp. AG855]RKE85749.1 uncharacterized protein DUF1499 [Rhizobium sp. AG855]